MTINQDTPSFMVANALNNLICSQWSKATDKELPDCLISQFEDETGHCVSWRAPNAALITPMLKIDNSLECEIEHDKHNIFSMEIWDLNDEEDQNQLADQLLEEILGWLS